MTVFLEILLAGAAVGLTVLWFKKRASDTALRTAQNQVVMVQQELTETQATIQSLSKYQGILDAEARAAAIVAEAQRHARAVMAAAEREAEVLLGRATATEEQARTATEALRASEAAAAREARQRAEALLSSARSEALGIVEAAKKQAQEIAGDAYAAMENARHLEQTARAMKNVIEGYGDQYVIPTMSLLDELAAEFGFSEAGQRLKQARDRVRQMIRDGLAAECDYVEANRKTTAIAFVLDAFNGKVDTVLADVRHDNYGTLAEKIKDSYRIVNHHGAAFRDARITPAYLDARLEELRWAVVAHELKQKDKEEQRLIKERIREEEKAQREYERAMRDAEKEEEMLRKAMEKARKDVERATDDQRAKFEEQLRELTERLKAAEEKNQRAISMAQQTKTGHVYIISNVGSFGEDVFKIGMTRRLVPQERVKELGDASVPFEFDVHAMIHSTDAPALELTLHRQFVRAQMNKVNPRKEFFRVSLHDIRSAVEGLGCQSTWTLAAEARDYKETLAIERAMAEKAGEQQWIARMLKEQETVSHQREEVEVA